MTWGKGWGLALILALPAGELWADSLRDAYSAFEKGQFEEAAQGFEAHTKKDPQDYDQLYNAGVALFQKGDFDKAIPYFDRAAQSPDARLKSRAHYNKGVVHAQKQDWEQAEAAFQEALSYDNDNRVIQENLEFVREQKNKQKPEQQNQNQNQAQNDSQKDKDQQKNESDQKQAQNDSAQKNEADKNQTDPNQKAEKKSGEAEKLAEEQKNSVSEQKGQPQHQEQQNAEQGSAAQQEKQESLAQKEGKDGEASKEAAMQAGDPAAQGHDPDKQRVLTIKDLKKQEAEKLLRSVDDRIGSYILTPEQANTEGKSRNGKDW
jgi:Ca-activated chloride channel family protein